MVRSDAFDYKRKFCEFWVDDTPLLSPDENVEIGYKDIEGSSAFDQNGFYHREVIRTGVRTWTFTYSVLTTAEYAFLRSIFSGKSTFIFSFVNENMGIEKMTAYCTWGNVAYKSLSSGQYRNLKITITEC